MSEQISINTIRDLVINAGAGVLSQEALKNERNLGELGFGSINYLNLMDSLENTFGIFIDPAEDVKFMHTVESIHQYIKRQIL